MLQTEGPDDGRYDAAGDLEFATTCCLLLGRGMLERIGLLDPECFLFWEDYELCARARAAGYRVRFVPGARMWHKVSRTTQEKKPNPFIWRTRARSKAVFCRRHPRYRSLCWPGYPYAAALGFLFSHKGCVAPAFLEGFRAGRSGALQPIPAWDEALSDKGRVVRGAR
jgi:GT2 family glycosyltransferase